MEVKGLSVLVEPLLVCMCVCSTLTELEHVTKSVTDGDLRQKQYSVCVCACVIEADLDK